MNHHHTNDPTNRQSLFTQAQRLMCPDIARMEQEIAELQLQVQQVRAHAEDDRRQWYQKGKEAVERECESKLQYLMRSYRPPCPMCHAPMAYTCLICSHSSHNTSPLMPQVMSTPFPHDEQPQTDHHLAIQGIRERATYRIASEDTRMIPTPPQQVRRNVR